MDTPLRRIRNVRSVTMAEIARALNTDKAHYSRIESGYTKIYIDEETGLPKKAQIMRASPDLAQKIAEFFGNAISTDQILFPEKYCAEVAAALREGEEYVAQHGSPKEAA